MVEYFKEALYLQGGGEVIGTNSEAETTGMYACNRSYVVPSVTDKNYIDVLLEIALKEKVKLIISLFDIDLPYLAQAKKRFEKKGIMVVISTEEVIDIANDKYKTFNFLKEHNILTPLTYCHYDQAIHALESKTLNFPLFVKPRWGMGSIGVYKAEDINELKFYFHNVQKQIKNSYLSKLTVASLDESVLIQESISGQEFGLDIFNDLNKNFFMSIEKEKIAMRSGETDAAIVIKNENLSKLSHELSIIIKHIGNLDVDVLFNGKDYYVLEINARFGGGFPFSYLAGANFPQLLLQMLNGEKPKVPLINIGTKGFKSIVPLKTN
jgi:carbamoyl-phosphate synthase large subunit